MANFSNYLEENLLDHVLRNSAFTSPSNVYVALFDDSASASQLEAGTLTNEITGYDGNRKSVTFGSPSQESGRGTVTNDNALTYENMPETTVSFVGIMDAEGTGGGNLLIWAELDTSRSTSSGDTFEIPSGDLTVDLD